MIEELLLNFLKESLDVPVHVTKKADINNYVFIEKVGSSRINHIYRDTFALQSYGDSLLKAARLNEKVKKVLDEELIKMNKISKVHCIDDYNFTDTTTKKYRYQTIYDLSLIHI